MIVQVSAELPASNDGWFVGRFATRCLALASDLLDTARAMLIKGTRGG